MKKERAVIFLAALLLSALLASPLAAKEPRLDGGYYMIGTAEELGWFRDAVNKGNFDINAKLVADIDLGGATWTPIGDGFCPELEDEEEFDYTAPTTEIHFGGVFDGQGHTVSHFRATAPNGYGGFFGLVIESGVLLETPPAAETSAIRTVVKNLHIKDAIVSYDNEDGRKRCCLGAIAGRADYALIENCTVTACEISAKYDAEAGGIAGVMDYATIMSCYVTDTTVKVRAYAEADEENDDALAGGIVGYCGSLSVVRDSTATLCTIDVYAHHWAGAGGIAGIGHGKSLENVRALRNKITASAPLETGEAQAGGIHAYGNTVLTAALSAYNTITADSYFDADISGIGGKNIYGCTAIGNVLSAVSKIGDIKAGGIAANPRMVYDSSVYGGSIILQSKSTDERDDVAAGGIAGEAPYLLDMGNCSVSDLKISVRADKASIHAGGLIAHFFAEGAISKSTVFGDTEITVSGGNKQNVGGLIGYMYGEAEITESVAALLSLNAPENAVLGAVIGYKEARRIVNNVWYLDTIAEKAIGKDKTLYTTGKITAFNANDTPATLDAVTCVIDKVAKIKKGGSETLSLISFPGTKNAAAGKLAWTVSDPFVAKHAANGIATTVTGVKPGGSLIAYGAARKVDKDNVADSNTEGQFVSAVFVMGQDDVDDEENEKER